MSPKIADSCFIAPTASILGDVEIEDGCGIWFGAVVRGDLNHIHIGEGSNVQDNCVVHTPPELGVSLGRNVSIGHGAIVHGATVGDDCIIGMNATLLNGCKIGAGSIIGANAMVREGQEIPPGSIAVGVPAKIIRSGDDGLLEACRRNAGTYHMLRDRHRQGSFPLYRP